MWFIRRFSAACCLIGVLTLNASAPYAQPVEAHALKAAYIYHFLSFVEWPGEKVVARHASVNVCVIGDSDLMQADHIFAAAKGSTKPVLVREKDAAHAAGRCHIVFIGRSEDIRLSGILAHFDNKPVLTVSDIEGFANRGGMIGFTLADDKVRLIVNLRAATDAGLRIDAQLLEIALRVVNR